MVRLTMITRVYDALPLAEGIETDKNLELDKFKAQAKQLFKRLAGSNNPPKRMSLEAGQFTFHYLIDTSVCHLTLVEKAYPKRLAFQYLEELRNEFSRLYGPQITQVQRPYAFINFDSFIQKTRKLYQDSRTQQNLGKLNEELTEVHQIMTKNIQDVLAQGEQLDNMTKMSSVLQAESKRYASRANDLYRQAIFRKYAPVAMIAGLILLVLWARRTFY